MGIHAAELRHKARNATREDPIKSGISARYEQDFSREAFWWAIDVGDRGGNAVLRDVIRLCGWHIKAVDLLGSRDEWRQDETLRERVSKLVFADAVPQPCAYVATFMIQTPNGGEIQKCAILGRNPVILAQLSNEYESVAQAAREYELLQIRGPRCRLL